MTLTERTPEWVPNTDSFATRLRLLRYELDMTVEQIAALCDIPAATWSTWERGARPRRMDDVVRQIANATKCSSYWLFCGNAPNLLNGSFDDAEQLSLDLFVPNPPFASAA